MKLLKTSYLPIKRITTLDFEKNIPIDKSDDIFSILGKVSSIKPEPGKRPNPGRLSLVLTPNVPFGPDPDLLKILLFEKQNYDFKSALIEVRKYFKIKKLDVFYSSSGKTAKPGKDSTIIDLIQFYNLYRASKHRVIDRMISVSFFIDADNSYSFLVKPGTKLSEIIHASDTLSTFLSRDNYDKNKNNNKEKTDIDTFIFYHPISGKVINPVNDTASEKNSIIFIEKRVDITGQENNEQTTTSCFRPLDSWFFPFPFFNRRIAFDTTKKKNNKPSPCINCLACVEYCPAGLHPSYLYHLIINKKTDEASRLNLKACTLCGKCNFVCPSSLPLADTIEEALEEINDNTEKTEVRESN